VDQSILGTSAIEFDAVEKRYGSHEALRSVSFNIEEGDYLGLVGANGAGKTTLIKSLLDFCNIDAGHIRINGQSHTHSQARAQIAYLPERFNPPYFQTGREFLSMMGCLHGAEVETRRLEATMEALEFEIDALSKPVRSLSKGMSQKLGLASCLLSEKPLMVMDEPMSGLDPKARALVKEQLLARRGSGQTLFFSTHLLSDIETLCTRVAVLHAAELQFVGTTQAFKERYSAESIDDAYLQCVAASD